MRILDEKGNELLDPDLELGHLVSDTLVKKHKAEPEIPMQTKRELVWEDPEDAENALYRVVVVQEYVPAKPAWDEVEHIQRYILYTPEELAQREADRLAAEEARKASEAEAKRQAELKAKIEALPSQVDDLNEAVAEVGVMVADGEVTTNEILEAVAELGVRVEEVAAAIPTN